MAKRRKPTALEVLQSNDLCSSIIAFQDGIYEDMIEICHAMVRYSPKDHPLYYCPDDIHPLLLSYKVDRLSLLVQCMPYMRNVLFLQAAQYGLLDLLHKLDSLYTLHVAPQFLLDLAAQNGHLDILQFLHAHAKHIVCTTMAMDSAASNGHYEVVKFLHLKRREGCTRGAIDGAAAAGHAEIVYFLNENRDEGCTKDAMDGAAAIGHLEIVQYLHENRYEGRLDSALAAAVDPSVRAYLEQAIEEEDDEDSDNEIDCNIEN